MKLHSLQIKPRKPGGWESEDLLFGEYITELFGPNGSGKTPIIKSVAYALGYPVKYREDIKEHCDSVELTLIADSGDRVAISRKIGTEFDAEVRVLDQAVQSFYSERDFSRFMFTVFGFQCPALTSVGNDATSAYMATLLPMFYLDQDIGYTSAYRAPVSFIKNQYAEMARMVFGLQPKNSFDRKKVVLEKKRRLDYLDQVVVAKETHIEGLLRRLGKLRRPIDGVASELARAKASLDGLKSSHDTKNDAELALDSLLYEKKTLRRQLRAQIADLELRVSSFGGIQSEIETELNTLSLNEEARRLFASFKDICANPNCGLLLGASDSYGKSLLYLRDQIKDLERNNLIQSSRIVEMSLEADGLESQISILERKREQYASATDTSALVETIGELTRTIISLQEEHAALHSISENEDEYVRALHERNSVQDELASLDSGAGVGDLKALKIRSDWNERIRHWLDVLQTRNVSREISIDADFEITFGAEKLTQFTGSTLLRVVLAIRTAAFEVYAGDSSRKLRFLILDTPRQQDIEKEALARYIAELRRLAVQTRAQVVFSTTDYHYDCVDGDVQWSPKFDGPEQKMFLRVTS